MGKVKFMKLFMKPILLMGKWFDIALFILIIIQCHYLSNAKERHTVLIQIP